MSPYIITHTPKKLQGMSHPFPFCDSIFCHTTPLSNQSCHTRLSTQSKPRIHVCHYIFSSLGHAPMLLKKTILHHTPNRVFPPTCSLPSFFPPLMHHATHHIITSNHHIQSLVMPHTNPISNSPRSWPRELEMD